MYVPPLEVLLKNLNLTLGEFTGAESVTIPVSFFRFLLQLVLVDCDFDAESYLEANPDIAIAVRNGAIRDARLHYVGDGYFEGRRGGTPAVDEDWYAATYLDVAAALRSGQVKSAAQHFQATGAAELRAPSPDYVVDAVQWGKALGK
jgi:hypothetical protein